MKVGLNEARNICSTVRKNFPYESPWLNAHKLRLECKKKGARMDKNILTKLLAEQEMIGEIRDARNFYVDTPFMYFKTLIDMVNRYKVQNCGELARIAYAVSRINLVNDSELELANLVAKKEKDYSKSLFPNIDKILDKMKEEEDGINARVVDHVALSINPRLEKGFVIDPLLNETDETDVVEFLYENKHCDLLQINPDETVTIVNYGKDENRLPSLNNSDSRKLARMYPSLVLPQNKNKLLKPKVFSFNIFELLQKKEKD